MIRSEDGLEESLKRKAYSIVISRLHEVIYGRRSLEELVNKAVRAAELDSP